MAVLKNIQTKITLPKDFDEQQRQLAAQLIIERIQSNTAMGKDRYGGSFPKYSNEYKSSLDFKNAGKSSLVNLSLSGDMVASIELVSSKPGEIVVGFKAGDPDAGKVEGSTIGSYGGESNAAHARPFIGLPQAQLDLIIAKVQDQTPQDTATRDNVTSIIGNLLSRFL